MVDDYERIREMLVDLEDYLDGLKEKQGVSFAQFNDNQDLQDIVERRLEKATQTCIDIGRLIGRIRGNDWSETPNAEVFDQLVHHEVLPETNRQEFIDIGGLRNALAHRYRHIDTREIYSSYHDLNRLERFSEHIYLYIHGKSE